MPAVILNPALTMPRFRLANQKASGCETLLLVAVDMVQMKGRKKTVG